MLVYPRADGALFDSTFAQFPSLLRAGDLVVFNDSRVIPARLRGMVEARALDAELLLVASRGERIWRCLGRPMRKLTPGTVMSCGALRAEVLGREGTDALLVRFDWDDARRSFEQMLEAVGRMPIPPYIRNGESDEQDRRDYQTIFARESGSIAAPTASLHFSQPVLRAITESGAAVCYLTLHVGVASILPLERSGGRPSAERYRMSHALVEQIATVRARGGRVFGVGTTAVRALESMVRSAEQIDDGALIETDLFIAPGFEFRAIDAMVTNFHQPGTSHLLLVEAFLGAREAIARSYHHALERGYRFLSYGDGMCIL